MENDLKNNLILSSSPHIRFEETTRSIMLDVIIALMPILGVAVYLFGWRALVVTLVSVASCIAFEFLWQRFMKKPIRVHDLSCVVTGMLLAFCLPVTVPYYVIVLGAAFAIIICKELYGGIGKNFANPAIAARIFLAVAYPKEMTGFIEPLLSKQAPIFGSMIDVTTRATPLVAMGNKALPAESLTDVFLGNIGGAMGETCSFLIIMCGLYLLFRGVIKLRIPISFIATVAFFAAIFHPSTVDTLKWVQYSVLTGGLLLGAVFMATDYATTPSTRLGQIIFGIGCGALTAFIRIFTPNPDGVAYAILFMNCTVGLIDKHIHPRRFGMKPFRKGLKPGFRAKKPEKKGV